MLELEEDARLDDAVEDAEGDEAAELEVEWTEEIALELADAEVDRAEVVVTEVEVDTGRS
jgi:hypothetical protein